MTKGQIPIIDRTGKRVAVLHWEGKPLGGKPRWQYLQDSATEQIKQAVAQGKTLSEQGFSNMYMDGETTRGWEGFSGWFQALFHALAVTEFTVDTKNIIWPDGSIEESA